MSLPSLYSFPNISQSFFGAMGCCVSLVFSTFGAAYGIAKSGIGVSAVSVHRPDDIIKITFPITLHLPSHARNSTNPIFRYDASYSSRNSLHLRPRGLSHHILLPSREIRSTYKLFTTCCWFLCRIELLGCGLYDWDHWGCWGSRNGYAA